MASNSETSHDKNMANFDELGVRATGLGAGFNPKQESISIPGMQALSATAHAAIEGVKAALPVWTNAVAAREKAFAPVNGMITRVMNALISSGADENVVENARTIARKILGTRRKAKLKPEEKESLKAHGTPVKEISSSQMSFDSRIGNIGGLVHLLGTISIYDPNEPELKTSSLNIWVEDLKTKNNAVKAAADPLNRARILRNQVLYNPKTGVVATAIMAKAYVKSVFGATNPTYKAISKLSFRTISLS